MARPEDFKVIYKWKEGSVPPPHHYEYEIHIGPKGKGRIIFRPDYPAEGLPVWNEEFSINSKSLDSLYELLLKKGILSQKWNAREGSTVGGEEEWIEVFAGNTHIKVPASIDKPEIVSDIYKYINSLVPEQIWEKLMSQRQNYEDGYTAR